MGTGPRRTETLLHIWSRPPSTKSDFARTHADEIAAAASEGLITTLWVDGTPTRTWRITAKGMRIIES